MVPIWYKWHNFRLHCRILGVRQYEVEFEIDLRPWVSGAMYYKLRFCARRRPTRNQVGAAMRLLPVEPLFPRWNDARTSIPCSRFSGFARASPCSNSASRSSYSARISRVESSPSVPDPSRSRLTKAAIGARNCVQVRRRYKGGSLPGAVSLETLN